MTLAEFIKAVDEFVGFRLNLISFKACNKSVKSVMSVKIERLVDRT